MVNLPDKFPQWPGVVAIDDEDDLQTPKVSRVMEASEGGGRVSDQDEEDDPLGDGHPMETELAQAPETQNEVFMIIRTAINKYVINS